MIILFQSLGWNPTTVFQVDLISKCSQIEKYIVGLQISSQIQAQNVQLSSINTTSIWNVGFWMRVVQYSIAGHYSWRDKDLGPWCHWLCYSRDKDCFWFRICLFVPDQWDYARWLMQRLQILYTYVMGLYFLNCMTAIVAAFVFLGIWQSCYHCSLQGVSTVRCS